MAAGTPTLLEALDREIATKERQLEEAKRAADQIATLTNDVVSLRRARQILAGDNSQSMQELIAQVNAPIPAVSNQNGASTVHPLPLSIGAAVLATLKTAGKPLKVPDLLSAARVATGKPDLTYHTLSAVLSVYRQNGKIRRTNTGIYALPKEASTANAG